MIFPRYATSSPRLPRADDLRDRANHVGCRDGAPHTGVARLRSVITEHEVVPRWDVPRLSEEHDICGAPSRCEVGLVQSLAVDVDEPVPLFVHGFPWQPD